MDRIVGQTFVRAALTLAILCIFCMLIVDPWTAEFYIMIISAVVNLMVSFVGHIINCRREKK